MGYVFALIVLAWIIYAAYFTSLFSPALVIVGLFLTSYVVAMAILFSSSHEES